MTKPVKGQAAKVRALRDDFAYWQGRYRIDLRSLRSTRVRVAGIRYKLQKLLLGEAAMTEERIPTVVRLVQALQAAGAPADMIERAQKGHYDEYKSALAAPILELAQDANMHGLKEIAARAIKGDFDSELWEADEWADSPEGKSVMKDMISQSPEMESVIEAEKRKANDRKKKHK